MENPADPQYAEASPPKPLFTLSRTYFYSIVFSILLLPSSLAFYYASRLGYSLLLPLLFVVGAGGALRILLQLWERQMQRSVAKLVQLRLQQAGGSPASEELRRIQKEWGESRRGYEHQIDLLQSSVAKSKEEVHQLNLTMDKQQEKLRAAHFAYEDLRKEYERLQEDQAQAYTENEQQIQHQTSLINEYQRTIAEQRLILEKKQHHIQKLESKVHDLTYEIRSLLQLEGPTPVDPTPALTHDYAPLPRPTQTSYDLSVQVQRFIEKAESQTGMEHLGGNAPRFLDLSDSYMVDRRRLFDSFRDEGNGILFIFSLGEKKFLFVNQQVKLLLGWSPEKFMKEFPRLVVAGYPEWRKTILRITPKQEQQLPLVIQSKLGEPKEFTCAMGLVTKGPFTNHIIGILVN